MLVILATLTAFFGDGNWECEYRNDYPEHDVRETAVGQIFYSNDLSYISERSLIYSKLSTDKVFAKFTFRESGRANVQSANEFYLDGRAYDFVEVFDPTNHFLDGYLRDLHRFFNRELSVEEKVLKVVERTSRHMKVLHEESGTYTECQALPKEL